MLIETDVVGLPVLVVGRAGPHRAGGASLPAGRRPGHPRGLAHGRHAGPRRVGADSRCSSGDAREWPQARARARRIGAGRRGGRPGRGRVAAWSSSAPAPAARGCSRSTGGGRSRTPTSCSPTAWPRWETSQRWLPGRRSSTSASCPGHHAVPQTEIERIMVERALAGLTVVRLKGGDPYVFGRGGEEVAAAVGAGVPVTVVPGVSSAVGVPGRRGHPRHPSRSQPRRDDRLGARAARRPAGQGARRPGRHRRRAHGHAQPRARSRPPSSAAASTPTPRLRSSSAASPPTSAVSSAPSAPCPGLVERGGAASPAVIVIGEVVRQSEVWARRAGARALEVVG